MRHCCVLNCKNNSGKSSSDPDRISFHLFPKDPETRQAWIYATGRINWTPRPYSTICSEHFTEYDFTMKNGKKFLRSTTVPRFNLNEQNSRYTESQYHNETQAALEFLTGKMFPETQIPAVEQETEVVTVQVVGGNNPNVVVRKPAAEPQYKPSTLEKTEKKPKYFSVINVFKSEAELKAEMDKVHELIRDNLDPSISKVLLSLQQPPKKWKKKIKTPTTPGKWAKSSIGDNTTTSDAHYMDTLTREELIHKLKQKDMKIRQLQLTIRELQKTHLRDQVQIESLQIKLKLSNPTSEAVVQAPQHTTSMIPAPQQIVIQHKQRMDTLNTGNHYQPNSNIPNQDQAYFDNQNRSSDIRLKKPARQQIVKQKQQRIEKTTNTENHNHSKGDFSNQFQAYLDSQNRHSDVGLKRSAPQKKIIKQKRQRIETTNAENRYQSIRNFSDLDQAQNRHWGVGLKRPSQQQKIVIEKQEILVPPRKENHTNQSNMIFSDQDRTHFFDF